MKSINYMVLAAALTALPALANENTSKIERSYKETKAQTKSTIGDSMITVKVKELFVVDENVSARKIHVTTDHGVVTLAGKVDTEYDKNVAIDLARSVDGVKAVKFDKLKVIFS